MRLFLSLVLTSVAMRCRAGIADDLSCCVVQDFVGAISYFLSSLLLLVFRSRWRSAIDCNPIGHTCTLGVRYGGGGRFYCIPDEGCTFFIHLFIASPMRNAHFSPVLLHPRREMHFFCPFYCIPDRECAFFARFAASPMGNAHFSPILLHPRREMHVFRPFRCIPDGRCTFSVIFDTPYTYGAMHSP